MGGEKHSRMEYALVEIGNTFFTRQETQRFAVRLSENLEIWGSLNFFSCKGGRTLALASSHRTCL